MARVATALLALLLAAPLPATVWTRSSLSVKIPKAGKVELANASYTSRDWSVSLKAFEAREQSRPAKGNVSTIWVFHYTNTDKEPHYVALSVRCLDSKRAERTRFEATAVLQPDRPNGATFEVAATMREDDWNQSAWTKVVVDFLSTPKG